MLMAGQMHPPFLFWSCQKRNGPCTVQREKTLWRAPVQWPSARDGGRRIGASADLARPSGTLGPSAGSILPSRGGWCGGRRGARTHLTSFSFRAFRFATRCMGCRGSWAAVGADALIGPLQKPRQPPGQRQRKSAQNVSLTSPGQRIPQGPGVSVPDRRKGPPTFPRRRQEVCACAGRPAVAFFLFGPCTARFSFGKAKRETGGASAQPSAWLSFRVQSDALLSTLPTFCGSRKEFILCAQS